MDTLLITRADAAELLDSTSLIPALKQGFIRHSSQHSVRPLRVRSDLPGPGTATVLFPGTLPDVPAYTVKVHAKFPDQIPAIRGVLCLHSSHTGDLLAVMDSTHLTAVRTGLAGAVAADALARRDAETVAILGAGVQGRQQLRSLAKLRTVREVTVYDINREIAYRFSDEMSRELNLLVAVAPNVASAVKSADIVLAATWAREPLIHAGMVRPGTHITTLGADEPGKAEVAAEVISKSLFICDDTDLALEMGALAAIGLSKKAVAAELGHVLAGTHPGRTSEEQVTVFGGVGLAFQDAVSAWLIYEQAKAKGVGRVIDFLA
jgi:ornithine cyclodeaminase